MSRPLVTAVCTLAMLALIGACSSDASTEDAIAVSSSDTKCTVAKTNLVAGKSTFLVKNDGGDAIFTMPSFLVYGVARIRLEAAR